MSHRKSDQENQARSRVARITGNIKRSAPIAGAGTDRHAGRTMNGVMGAHNPGQRPILGHRRAMRDAASRFAYSADSGLIQQR